MSLWPHQELGLTALRAAVAAGETKICITSPTGGGKSRMMFELLLSDAASAAVYTDRRMLCEQLTGNMTAAGIKHGIIASGMEPSIAEVQLCMAQTMVSKCVKGLQRVPNVDFCIWDECVAEGSLVRTERGWVPIEDAVKCKYVLSCAGGTQKYCRITHHFNVGVRSVLSVELNGGETLKCTENHLVLTPRGWITARDLKTGDSIASVGAVSRLQSRGIDLSTSTIFERETLRSNSQKRKSKRFSGHFLEIQASGMRTSIQQPREFLETTLPSNLSGLSTNARFFATLEHSGILPRMAAMGTSTLDGEPEPVGLSLLSRNSLRKKERSSLRPNGLTALVASGLRGGFVTMGAEVQTLSHFTQKDIPSKSSWLSKIGSQVDLDLFLFLKREEETSLTYLEELEIQFGPSCSPMFPTACGINWSQVTRIAQRESVRVYDMEVEGTHCYFANGLLVHNCHKMGGDTLLELRKHHWRAIDIGFTATPLGIGHVYEHLIVAGTNSELRDCGALVPAFHFGPDEPDIKWVGQVKVDDGECGLPKSKRQEFAHRVFGRVVENYLSINPGRKPTVLFAPGVAESIWFAQELCKHGIPAAHVDGDSVWLNGELIPKDQDLVNDVRDMLEDGTLAIVCNRFVLREGIDWPFVEHGIFATIFGSLTSYLQAGGRFLRACPRTSKTRCTIQDHGGNWHRHGSLNSDREWDLGFDDRIVAGIREKLLREKKEREPIVCPNCNAVRLSGPKCFMCGHQHDSRVRIVLQQDGTLREMKGDIYKARRTLKKTAELETEWASRVKAVQKSQKPSVMKMTFSQLANSFARDHNWAHPPEDLPLMPTHVGDWFRPVRDISDDRLT